MQQVQRSNVVSFEAFKSSKPQPVERRAAQRKRVIRAGTAAYPAGDKSADCMIRNLSAIGAQLTAVNAAWIPDSFELRIDSDGTEAECEVIWRSDTEVSVRFINAPRTPDGAA